MNQGARLARASAAQAARDPQQRRCYNAEREIAARLGAGRKFASLDEIQKYVDKLLDSRAVVERFGTRRVVVRPGESRSARGGHGMISMPRWSWSEQHVLHEVAHCLASVHANHDPEFVGVYRFLVETAMGKPYAVELSNAWWERGVDWHAVPPAVRQRYVDHVERKKRERAEQRAKRKTAALRKQVEKQRPPTSSEIELAVQTIRRAAKSGVWGPNGSTMRTRALTAARQLEASLKS